MLRRLMAFLALRTGVLPGDVKGATAIEYALIAALIGTAIVAGVTQVGVSLQSVFQAIAGAFPK